MATQRPPKKTKRALVTIAPDADRVLAPCRKLRDRLRRSTSTVTATSKAAAVIPPDIIQVQDAAAPIVLDAMERIAMTISNQVLKKRGFGLDIPSRAASNQVYLPAPWDRIVLGPKRSTRSFLNVKESRKAAITLRVLQLIHAVLVKRIHITKRDLFYTDVKLFVEQAESDGVLDDIATMVGCTRSKYVRWRVSRRSELVWYSLASCISS